MGAQSLNTLGCTPESLKSWTGLTVFVDHLTTLGGLVIRGKAVRNVSVKMVLTSPGNYICDSYSIP